MDTLEMLSICHACANQVMTFNEFVEELDRVNFSNQPLAMEYVLRLIDKKTIADRFLNARRNGASWSCIHALVAAEKEANELTAQARARLVEAL